MASNGLLLEVRFQWAGTSLATDTALNATVISVNDPEAIAVDQDVWIGGLGPHLVTDRDVDNDTLTITPGLTDNLESGTEVVPDAGGHPTQMWVAEVMLPDAAEPIEVPLTVHDLSVMDEGTYNPPIAILLSDDLEHVLDLPGSNPIISGAFIPPESLPPSQGGGNNVYRQPEPPWPDGEGGHPDNDLWYDTDHEDGIHPFMWDADNLIWVSVADPAVDVLDDAGSIVVGDKTLREIAEQAQNASEVATSARNLASTADGRVSFSDYDPTPDDVSYYVVNRDGTLSKGTSWDILQAELTTGIATLTLADSGMTMNDDEYIIVEGISSIFDGEWTVLSSSNTTITVTDAQLTSGTATLTLSSASPWAVGQTVIIGGLDSTLNGNVTLTASSGNTISYTVPGGPEDIPAGSASGTAAVYLVQYRIPNQPNVARFSVPVAAIGYNAVLLNRIAGSVWYTRTRARKNFVTNPSFEISTTGWTASQATLARVQPGSTPIAGSWAMRVTNDSTTNDHIARWNGGTPGLPATAGKTYAATAFTLLETGSGAGAFASLRFFDSGGVEIPGSEVAGPAISLATDDWRELRVTGTAPTGTAYVSAINLHNPNASAVWLVDGALMEEAEYTGRYFDGDTYDAVWGNLVPATGGGDGTPHASFSTMEGGKIVSVWELYDGDWVNLDFTGSTQYDSDAADLTKGFLAPARLADESVPVDKIKSQMVTASDAVTAGQFVNIWNNNGLFQCRPANASNGREAHGFVRKDAGAGTAVAVVTWGINAHVVGLTPGPQFLSAVTPGLAVPAPPTGSGKIIQELGVATSASTLNFNPQQPVLLF